MKAVLEDLRGATARAGDLAGAELYTFDDKGKAVAFGSAMGSDTESNAVQLWSTVAPAVELAYQDMQERLLPAESVAWWSAARLAEPAPVPRNRHRGAVA